MPNPAFIYLHDTPTSHLFAAKHRAISHGCIRVERPEELANYPLASNGNWNSDKLSKYTNLKDPIQVDLQRTVLIPLRIKRRG
jgi:murein L,D-transpeptidase YcbB/YkuD